MGLYLLLLHKASSALKQKLVCSGWVKGERERTLGKYTFDSRLTLLVPSRSELSVVGVQLRFLTKVRKQITRERERERERERVRENLCTQSKWYGESVKTLAEPNEISYESFLTRARSTCSGGRQHQARIALPKWLVSRH